MTQGFRILLANSDMQYRGGTQAWIRQMYRTLSGNHEVDVFSSNGHVPDDLRPFDRTKGYDVALINHWTATQALRTADIGRRIVTSHGVIPHEEIPVLGADAYVSVSEAVQRKVPFRSTVIRNPIDADHFLPLTPVSPTLERVAFVSNRQGNALPLVKAASELLDVEFRVVGKDTAVSDTLEIYNWADLVVGIARVAMEAMACGRNVLVMDYVGFHGLARPENIGKLRTSNYGGHEFRTWPTVEGLAEELRRYDPAVNLRDEIIAHHDPRTVADTYLELARSTRPSKAARLVRRGPRQLSSPKITQVLQRVHDLKSIRAWTQAPQ